MFKFFTQFGGSAAVVLAIDIILLILLG